MMLKNSPRNCNENLSFIVKFLKAEKSQRWKPGVTVCPGRLPRTWKPVKGMHPAGVPGRGTVLPFASVPKVQGCWNAFGLPNQFSFPFESV